MVSIIECNGQQALSKVFIFWRHREFLYFNFKNKIGRSDRRSWPGFARQAPRIPFELVAFGEVSFWVLPVRPQPADAACQIVQPIVDWRRVGHHRPR